MATLRNPFLFVLLTHWVSLSTGTNEGDFDKSLSNSSTVPLQDKFNESSVRVPDNASSLNSFENVSLHLEPTTSLLGLIEEEKEIEVELKNLLEEAASSGQLIVLSDSQAENSNLSSIISSPLLMIENLSTTPRSPIDRSTTTSDQEIAQSQIRTRTRPRNHEEYEDIENFEDLLAIAEYEPQKLDVQETTSTETPNVETTSHRPPEEVHYDVPRRRNLTATPERPGTQVRGSTIPKTDFDDSRGQVTITESSKDPSRYQKDRTTPEHSHKAAGKKSLLPSNTHKKLSNLQEKWLRGPRHLKVLPPKNDPLEILVPREAEEYSKHPRRNGSDLENVSNFSASVRREFPPATRASPATLPLTYPTIGPNQLAVAPQRKYHEPGALPLKHPRPVNRRSDYLDYGPSEIHSLNYNLPSRPAKRPSNPEPYPAVPARTNRPNIPAENAEKESVESSSPEESAEYDYYEESEEQKQPSQRKPYSADYPEKEIPSVKAIASYDTYDESPEQRQPSQRPAYPDKGTSNSRVIPVYDSYDESDEQRRPSQRTSSPAVYPAKETSDAKVIPARGSYEENADPNPSRSYRNGAAPSPKSTESEYADYGSEEVPAKPESRQSSPRFHPAANELQALTANRFVGAPTQSVDYGHLATTIGPAARSNLVRAPIYPYQHYYSNAKPSVPVGDENERRSVAATKYPQNVYPPRVTYGAGEASPESSLEDLRKPAGHQKYVGERYVNSENVKNERLMEGGKPARRTNSDKVDGDDYRSESRSAPASPSLSQVPQFNPQNTLIAPVKPPSRAHRTVPRIINGYVANDYKLSSPISSIENREVGGSDRRNSGKVPAYDFYDAYKSINSSPVAPRPTLVPENSDHYGSRVIPLKDSERQNPSPAASPQTHQIRSIDSSIDRTRLPRIPVRNHAEPAESVQQASSLVDARDYEDEVPASSGHEENHETHADSKKDEGTEEESEKGGGEKHEEAHHNSSGEKAEKEYKEWHEYDKAKKGHHDKEHHDNEYHEEKGGKKKHEEESGYHKEHHRGEKGSKESEFAEKGKHEKGHSTKGEHVVHKKDEYEKKTEFYDESHEEDGDEKEGEYHHEHEEKKGGHEKIGHHDSAHRIDKYGEKGEHEKGHHWHETKGHEKKDGREEEHSHEEKYGKKGGHEEGEKWSHNNGDKGQR